jgi:hypothetical protein
MTAVIKTLLDQVIMAPAGEQQWNATDRQRLSIANGQQLAAADGQQSNLTDGPADYCVELSCFCPLQ